MHVADLPTSIRAGTSWYEFDRKGYVLAWGPRPDGANQLRDVTIRIGDERVSELTVLARQRLLVISDSWSKGIVKERLLARAKGGDEVIEARW